MLRVFMPAIAAFAVAGCFEEQVLDYTPIEQTAKFFPTTFEMPVTLRLANVEIEAEAKMESSGNTRTIKVTRDGVPIEEEVFFVTAESVAVKSLGTGERFDPPLMLFKVPFTIGDSFEWSGNIDLAGPAIKASAKSVTSRDRPDLATGPREALKVAVDLIIDDGSPKPALRKLDFWFVDGVGPVRRDYGNQIRTPR